MYSKKLREEQLREAACFGDLKTLKDLIVSGVDFNSKNDMNGWSALHWAAYRGNIEIVTILLRNGADKMALTNKGETPYDLASCDKIQLLLQGKTHEKTEESLPIVPNYLRNPQFLYSNPKNIETDLGG